MKKIPIAPENEVACGRAEGSRKHTLLVLELERKWLTSSKVNSPWVVGILGKTNNQSFKTPRWKSLKN